MPSGSLHRWCHSLARPVFPRVVFIFSPSPPAPPLPRLCSCCCCFFFSTDVFKCDGGAGSFPFVWGFMAELHCCASQGGIISSYGLAANSGSPWILQAPNLHFSDAVVNQWIVLSTFQNNWGQMHSWRHYWQLLSAILWNGGKFFI